MEKLAIYFLISSMKNIVKSHTDVPAASLRLSQSVRADWSDMATSISEEIEVFAARK